MACAEEPVATDVVLLSAIALGGVLGSLARYGIGEAWPARTGFPWATLCINAGGCLLIGILMVALTERTARPHRLARPFLGVGVLGGFTTFSAYSVDTIRLLDADRVGLAVAYVLATPLVAILAVWCGARLTRGTS